MNDSDRRNDNKGNTMNDNDRRNGNKRNTMNDSNRRNGQWLTMTEGITIKGIQ